MLLSFVYWIMVLIMGPVTVFGLGNTIYQDELAQSIADAYAACLETNAGAEDAISICTVV